MRKIICCFLLLMLLHGISSAQEATYSTIRDVAFKGGNFTSDPLGNFYWYQAGDVVKFNPDGKPQSRFSSREFGAISYVDASNPMKVLVVFADFYKALVLDASMSTTNTIDLNFNGAIKTNLICSSETGGYWIFDSYSKKLKKLNDQLQSVAEGTELRQITEDPVIPDMLTESGDWVILNVRDYGIMVFDRYGTYFKTIKEKINRQIQIQGDYLMFKKGVGMEKINLKSSEIQHFILPDNPAESEARVEAHRIFIWDNGIMHIYGY